MADSKFVGIVRADIELNHPMPWTVYDGDGNLLLRKGFIITSERQLEALLARGIHRLANEDPEAVQKDESLDFRRSINPFELHESLIKRLGKKWKLLHRLVYLAAPLVILHYAWAQKGDIFRLQGDILGPVGFGIVVAVLLILRIPVVRGFFSNLRARSNFRILPKSS